MLLNLQLDEIPLPECLLCVSALCITIVNILRYAEEALRLISFYFRLIMCIADRDECREWGYCHQLCENTDGSYQCSCMTGYTLVDRSRCIAPNNSSLLLFFAHDHSVWRMTAQGHDFELVANTTGASGLDFHYSRNQLYWSDVKTRKVYI